MSNSGAVVFKTTVLSSQLFVVQPTKKLFPTLTNAHFFVAHLVLCCPLVLC